MDLASVAPILCAGLTIYKGLKESGARPGETVAIVGAGGGLGSFALQYAKAMGLRTISIDTGEERRKLCHELGSYAFVDFNTSKNVVKDVQSATEDGLGPHAVLVTAVNEKPFQQAAEVCSSSPNTGYETSANLQSMSALVVLSCASVYPPMLSSRPQSSKLS
jgi:propanol-preferring alcohol dehydrogenase